MALRAGNHAPFELPEVNNSTAGRNFGLNSDADWVSMLSAVDETAGDVAVSGPSLGATWRAFVGSLERGERAALEEALVSIGIRGDETAHAWDAFVRLAPNRAMPRYALTASAARHLSAPALDRFVTAHHHGAFYWNLADRIVDHQAHPTPALTAARGTLLAAWVDALAACVGDRGAARAIIARDLREWRRGVDLGRAALRLGRTSPEEHLRAVSARLCCVSTAARAMLESVGERAAAAAFRRACDLFLFACQCRDDAVDDDEDRRCLGRSTSDLLGVSAGGLFRAATRLTRWAAVEAARGGFDAFARWLDGFALTADMAWPNEPAASQMFNAFALLEGLRGLSPDPATSERRSASDE